MPSSTAFGRVVKIQVSGDYSTTFDGDSLEIHFECPFDDEPVPNMSTVDIYNLSRSSISKIQKGGTCTVQAGYRGDYGVIASGKITAVTSSWSEADKMTTITFSEGEDISNKTDKVSFAKGTHGSTIIKRLCKDARIKLAYFSLPYNKVYTSGFQVDGDIQDTLQQVASDCKASIYYRRGKMVVRSIKEGFDEQFTLDSNSGLIETPEAFDDDANGKGYNFKCLLQHRATVASIFSLKSLTANGKYRIKNGSHVCDGNDFYTQGMMV